MAKGVRTLLKADIGLSVTGVAGPDEQDGLPAGTVFVGLAFDGREEHVALRLPGDRPRVRAYSAISALDALRRSLDSHA
jgi:nicotinamide mononucleotide (NMN) deamidase PncC